MGWRLMIGIREGMVLLSWGLETWWWCRESVNMKKKLEVR